MIKQRTVKRKSNKTIQRNEDNNNKVLLALVLLLGSAAASKTTLVVVAIAIGGSVRVGTQRTIDAHIDSELEP